MHEKCKMTTIDKLISENNVDNILNECVKTNQYNLGRLLLNIYGRENVSEKIYEKLTTRNCVPDTRVMLLCNWTNTQTLTHIWNKMSKGNYTWNNIVLVVEEPVDYYVVINMPPADAKIVPEKTIVFQMEPNMYNHKEMWGEWANPVDKGYKFVGMHVKEYNNNEWHISKTYNELCSEVIKKDEKVANILSTILSDKYRDIGHVKRIDFVKFLESKGMTVHVYGNNKFDWKNYKGELPYHQKDASLLPYKYTFNAENQNIPNYYTEKLIDGILSECLVFYSGCPNIRTFFDDRAYVWLELVDFEHDYQLVKRAIEEDWHAQRLPYILEAKHKILHEKQFFPRLEKIIAKQ